MRSSIATTNWIPSATWLPTIQTMLKSAARNSKPTLIKSGSRILRAGRTASVGVRVTQPERKSH